MLKGFSKDLCCNSIGTLYLNKLCPPEVGMLIPKFFKFVFNKDLKDPFDKEKAESHISGFLSANTHTESHVMLPGERGC